ncbi:MAG: DUF927 domain-containing protein [Candidatus Caldatribacteriaceae bacterium]
MVKIVELPDLPPKGDVSDWLDADGTKEKLLELVEAAAPWEPKTTPDATPELRTCEYAFEGGRTIWFRETHFGPMPVTLAQFEARIEQEKLLDDGAETTLTFAISGTLADGAALPRIEIPAAQFASMSWPVERWGTRAIVAAGQGAKDRLREAIQTLSGNVPRTVVFTHLGWRKIEGEWTYLHAGGSIGAEALVEAGDELKGYSLPESAENPAEAIRHSLELLDVAPRSVTIPLLAAVYRAPTAFMKYPSLLFWIYGLTGSQKSTLAALFLSHFGGPFDASFLPVSWLATENALEEVLFRARDKLVVIDDWAPEKHRLQAAELERKAGRIARQIGNRQARARLRSDLSRRPDRPPNALVVSTGEQLPLGIPSILARLFPIPVKPGDVDLKKLSKAQATADRLSHAMRAYIEWLRPRIEQRHEELEKVFLEIRNRS